MPAPIPRRTKAYLPHRRHAEQDVETDRADQPHDQHGPPADPIGRSSPQRREDERHRREAGHQEANLPSLLLHAERPGINGQERQHHAKAQQVDEHRQKNDQQRSAAGRRAGVFDFRWSRACAGRARRIVGVRRGRLIVSSHAESRPIGRGGTVPLSRIATDPAAAGFRRMFPLACKPVELKSTCLLRRQSLLKQLAATFHVGAQVLPVERSRTAVTTAAVGGGRSGRGSSCWPAWQLRCCCGWRSALAMAAGWQSDPAVGTRLTAQSSAMTGNPPPVSLAELQDKVTLINFWGPWCGYCVVEFRTWSTRTALSRRAGVPVLWYPLIDPPDEQGLLESTEEFLKQQRMSFPHIAIRAAEHHCSGQNHLTYGLRLSRRSWSISIGSCAASGLASPGDGHAAND
jgi:thiol-disulfide isomerase/thioredoxin